MQKLRWLPVLMGITILGITGFQLFWLKNNYDREKLSLELRTNAEFRQTILGLQATKLKIDSMSFQLDSFAMPVVMRLGKKEKQQVIRTEMRKEAPITMINLLQEKMKGDEKDTGRRKTIIYSGNDSSLQVFHPDSIQRNHFRGSVREITLQRNNDSQQGPGLINEIRQLTREEQSRPVGKKLTINYAHKPGNKTPIDSITIMTTSPGGIILEDQSPGFSRKDVLTDRELGNDPGREELVRFLYKVDSLSVKDSVTVKEINKAFAAKLEEGKMDIGFSVNKLDSSQANSAALNEVTIGFTKPATFRLSLKNKLAYILEKLTLPILFSIFLVGLTVASFVLLYRNLVRQRKLALLKNEFISNITHELKTPLATVGVAIEALKNFNAMDDPGRTREYLDISQNELQRLSLLVDKVLKLSMFENKEMELKKEQFDCKQLSGEIMNSMKLQFEKYHAKVKLHTEGGNFIIEADKLHITSVIYNLLDNALKYGKEYPVIEVKLISGPENIELSVKDNGIGIAPAYKGKIFDKFFRVPAGDKHNIKGYGLGLSYVAEVIKRHHGHVNVESEPGKGSVFTAKLPYAVAT